LKLLEIIQNNIQDYGGSMTITVSVIGCGSISRFHFNALERSGIKIKWVCDLNPEASEPYARRFNAMPTQEHHQAIEDPEVQAVFVLTHSSTHKTICMDAIDAGKAVVCEKTLAIDAEDSKAITRFAREKGTIFYTSYMKRFIPAVAKAKSLMPRIGKVFSTHIRTYQPWGNLWDGNPIDGFFHKPKKESSMVTRYYGGGILVCGGSHLLDLICFFLGRPHHLYAKIFQPSDLDYDLLASAIMETDNGIVHFEAAAHPLQKIGFLRDGWDERIEINGTEGRLDIFSALWDQPEMKDSILVHYDNRTGEVTEYRFGPISPFDRAVSFFVKNIFENTQGSQPITTGYDVDELISHIKISNASQQMVEIDWKL
jgi:myo-inositol 2-dehydrogenase/D-chiro-inositol 1-dehydrogenase